MSFGPSSPWKRPDAITVITRIGITREKTSAEPSRKKMRRSLRKTASMTSALGGRDLGAQALEQALEGVLLHRRVELGAEVLRQADALDVDVGCAPALGVLVQLVVDRELVARGDHLRRDARLVAVDRLTAVGEVGCIEQEETLHVGSDEELVKELQELVRLGLAAAVEVRTRREPGQRVRVEEAAQEIAQLGELLLAVAAATDDGVAALEDAARERQRRFLSRNRPGGGDGDRRREKHGRAPRHPSRSSLPVSSRKTSSRVTGVTRVRTMLCPSEAIAR